MPRIAVLASGTGSILEALLEAGLPTAVVITDRACAAEDVALARGVPIRRVERSSFGPDFDRNAYTCDVVEVLAPYGVSVVAMAGFGTVLGEAIHRAYSGRVLNTHPSLLPAFKGWHAVADALAAGVDETGCTVHVATLEVDDGPVLAQEVVEVLPGETVKTLHERIKKVERRLYPATVRRFLESLEEASA